MQTVNVIEARARLLELLEQVATTHQPLLIASQRNRAVLVCEKDWNAINESLFLMSAPGMRESLCEGMLLPLEDCGTELDW